jgi:methylated-DNA-protein-cysteine methyltransferase-like protein
VSETKSFSNSIISFVRQIPEGRVMTYGQLAALAGSPRSARAVGGLAHFGDPTLPWHRVVNKQGGLASGYPGGRKAHKEHLEAEGIVVGGEPGNYSVDVKKLIWWPQQATPAIGDRRLKNED